MDLPALQARVRAFAVARQWQRFHTPKNLSMALMVEAAELMEIFQWLTPEESVHAADDATRKQHIGEEIADVLIYLLQLADHTGVDIEQAVHGKMAINARKHPAVDGAVNPPRPGPVVWPAQGDARRDLQGGAPDEVPGDTHVLLDYENVQPSEADVRLMVPQACKLWVFHGPHQHQAGTRFESFGNDLVAVPITRTGKNALDFHLSFYMGYIAARNPDARFVVLANDKGYGPMLDHARDLGFDVQALGVPRVAKARVQRAARPAAAGAPAAKTPARKTAGTAGVKRAAAPSADKPAPAVKAAARRPAARKVTAKKAAPAPMPQPPAAKQARAPAKKRSAQALPTKAAVDSDMKTKIEQGLHKLGPKRPTRLARLRGVVKSLLGGTASSSQISAALATLIEANRVRINADGEVSYPGWG